ncbi:unnamed protein product, partial [Scytosiphon promiscuus]
EYPWDEQAPGHEVHRRQGRADSDEICEFVATGSPHEGIGLVPDRRDERPRRRQQNGHDERLVAHLLSDLKEKGRGESRRSMRGCHVGRWAGVFVCFYRFPR